MSYRWIVSLTQSCTSMRADELANTLFFPSPGMPEP